MSTKKFLLILLVYCPLIIPTDVSAWDHQRKGFILGMGMGPAVTRTKSLIGDRTEFEGSNGFRIDARIGYATSNTFQLYFYDHISIFDDTFIDSVTVFTIDPPFTRIRATEGQVGHIGFGLGVSYYQKQEAPSFFFDGGLGFCMFGDPVAGGTKEGGAVSIVGGYEFSKHWSIKFGFEGASSSSEDYSRDKKASIMTLMFTINALGY